MIWLLLCCSAPVPEPFIGPLDWPVVVDTGEVVYAAAAMP